MRKKPTEHSWSIYRIRGTPAVLVGIVEALAEQAAIQKAIEEYKVTCPEQQKRLVARRQQ